MDSNINSDLKIESLINSGSTTALKKRILVIDDEPFNVISMQLTLSNVGFRGLGNLVDRAYNGLEGLTKVKDALSKGTHVYGLIITDISMPIMDGYELAIGIRDFYRANKVPQPLIIACTGHVEEEYIKKAWMHDIDEILPKPVNTESLTQIMKEHIQIPSE